MTITITPTLYEHVGVYSVDAVFTAPLSSTKSALFTLTVNDPCDFDNTRMTVTHAFTPALLPYKIADPAATSALVFSDTISDHFGVPYTCGKWTFASLADDVTDSPFPNMITVTGNS